MKTKPTRLRPDQGGAMRTVAPLFAPTLKLGANGEAFATSSDRGRPPDERDRSRANRCDCGNPDCELPIGRCFLCKSPVVNDRTYAVCADCDEQHRVRETWQARYENEESIHKATSDRECFCPGWLWMNEDDDASFNIERCDGCAVYDDDTSAAEAMVAACRCGRIEWP